MGSPELSFLQSLRVHQRSNRLGHSARAASELPQPAARPSVLLDGACRHQAAMDSGPSRTARRRRGTLSGAFTGTTLQRSGVGSVAPLCRPRDVGRHYGHSRCAVDWNDDERLAACDVDRDLSLAAVEGEPSGRREKVVDDRVRRDAVRFCRWPEVDGCAVCREPLPGIARDPTSLPISRDRVRGGVCRLSRHGIPCRVWLLAAADVRQVR